jgi:hypothetical protein
MKKSLLITLLGVLSISLANAQPTGVTATEIGPRSATLSWDAAGSETSWNLRYISSNDTENVSLFADFENGIGDGWFVIDNDGDDVNWMFGEGYGFEESTGLVSPSYYNGEDLDSDNILGTPLVALDGTLSFWAASYSSYYPDSFSVLLHIGDFTESTVDEFFANCVELLPSTEAPQGGKEYSIELSQYAGQEGIIIFRHQSSAMFYFLLDNIMIVNGWNTITGVTNPYTLTGLSPLTSYAVQVQAADGGAWSDSYNFVTSDATPAPTNVYADNVTISSADIYWDADETATSFNVKYRKSPEAESFEDGTLAGWTAVDADGDGFGWENGMVQGNFSNHTGDGCLVSASYDNDTHTALTPDNWLISPQITLGGDISFYAKGQDASYCEEHFAVFVSTSGTDPENFVQVSEEFVATEEYVLYSVDLSDYSGQGYVAIRHFNVTDMFYLNIDDIAISQPGENPWTTLTTDEPQVALENLEALSTYEVMVQAVYDEGLSPWVLCLFTTPGDIVLYASDPNGTNLEILRAQDGHEIPSVMIDGLILNNDGLYHPICLPFSLTADELADSPLAGITLKVPTSFVEEEGESKVYFEDATEIEANRVYFYKLTGDPIRSPMFENVTIESEGAEYTNYITADMYDASVYSLYTISYSSDFPIYAYDDENQFFYQCSSYATQPFAGHLLFFNEAEEVTAVFETESEIPTGISEVTTKSNGTWFNAQGVKLNGKPAQKGIYVSNGKKFVVK